MESDRLDELERRVAALETELEAWRARTRRLVERRYGGDAGSRPGAPVSGPRFPWKKVADALTGEGAIGRIGIGLVLLGLVYAVQYGIDRGWITELVQVALAVVFGGVLLVLGQWLVARRPILSRLLTGGGFGALYVAVYAAQAVYGLIPFGAAIGAMSLVTAGCFLVGTLRADAAMAMVAVAGGLATPFVIHSGDTDVVGLSLYVTIVLAVSGLLYWRHGWRLLLAWSALVSLPVLTVAVTVLHEPEVIPAGWRWAMQGALVVELVIFTAMPLARGAFAGRRRAPDLPDGMRAGIARLLGPVVAVVVLFSVWLMERGVWSLGDLSWAGIDLAAAALAAAAYRALERRERTLEEATTLFIGSWLAALAFVDAFDGGGLSMAGWSLVLAVLVVAWNRRNRPGALVTAGSLAIVLVFWLPNRIVEAGDPGPPFLSWDAAGDALSLIFVALAARKVEPQRLRIVVGMVLWGATLALLGREFDGAGAVTTAWSVFAVVLLAAGRYGRTIRLAGMLTVVLVVAKLLLFDLSRLDGLVRVGLFVGFGVVLLAVSYFFPSWWKLSDGRQAGVAAPDDGDEPYAARDARSSR